MKSILLFILFMALGIGIFAQAPLKMNYQAVARDDQGELMRNKLLGVRIALLDESNRVVFSESHSVYTSSNGTFNLIIGDGQRITGSLQSLDWSTGDVFVEVAIDTEGGSAYTVAGTSQLLSVPYALYSADTGNKDDADADPTNEIQFLSFDENTGILSISQGNQVTLPATSGGDNWGSQTVVSDNSLSGAGTASDPLRVNVNEVDKQTLDLQSSILSISNGNSVNLASINTDNQTLSIGGDTLRISNGNEVLLSHINTDSQTLSIGGDTLRISNGNEVLLSHINTDSQTLSIGGDTLRISNGNEVLLSHINTDSQTLSIGGDTLRISNGNEILIGHINTDNQTLSFTGSQLSISNGNSVNISSINTDNQTLSLSGQQLSISNGNMVDLSPLVQSATQNLSYNPANSILSISGGNSVNLQSLLGIGGTGEQGYIPLFTNSTTLENSKMFQSGSGSIGIDVNNPASKFHIHQNAPNPNGLRISTSVTGNSITDGLFIGYGAFGQNVAQIRNFEDADIQFMIDTVASATVKPNGRFSIGTSSSVSNLTIHENTTQPVGIRISNLHTGFGTFRGTFMGYGFQNSNDYYIYNFENGDLRLGTNGADRLAIKPTGRVGIGIMNPGNRLHLHEPANTGVVMQFTNLFTGSTALDGTFLGYLNQSNNDFTFFNSENGDLRLGTNGQTNHVIVKANGRIGFGTINPARDLVVFKPFSSSFIRAESEGSGNISGIELVSAAQLNQFRMVNDAFLSFQISSNSDFPVNTTHTMFTAMRFQGFGFLSPGQDNYYDLGSSGARWKTVFAANGVINTSDRRLKTNILPIQYGLSSILQLAPVQYNWIGKEDEKTMLGLLAQDLQEIIPEAVYPGDNENDTMGINYTEIVPVLIKAIQELNEKIDNLESRLIQCEASTANR